MSLYFGQNRAEFRQALSQCPINLHQVGLTWHHFFGYHSRGSSTLPATAKNEGGEQCAEGDRRARPAVSISVDADICLSVSSVAGHLLGRFKVALREEIMGRGLSWKPFEDKLLARAWVQCSEDAIGGAEQASETFYDEISEAYARLAPEGASERTGKACKCRFSIISREVQKFSGHYRRIQMEKPSGKSEKDLLEDAARLYWKTGDGEPFKDFPMLGAWYVLKESPKWRGGGKQEDMRACGTKRSRESSSDVLRVESEGQGDSSITVQEENSQSRPIGRKRAKMESELCRAYYHMSANVGRVADEMRNRAKIVKEQNFVLALTASPVPRSQAAKEFFDMIEQEAVITKRMDLKKLRSTAAQRTTEVIPQNGVDDEGSQEEQVPKIFLGKRCGES